MTPITFEDVLGEKEFKRLVYFAYRKLNIKLPNKFVHSFEDLLHEVRVSIFQDMRMRKHALATTTIIVNHTRFVLFGHGVSKKKQLTIEQKIPLDEFVTRDQTDRQRRENRLTLVNQIINTLSPRYREIIRLRMNGRKLHEIGSQFNLSKERVRQIESRAIAQIKEKIREKQDEL